MAFSHPQLHQVLSWKQPGREWSLVNGRIETYKGERPTDTQLQQWIDEYEALPPDSKEKDPRRNRIKRLREVTNLPELKILIEELLESLV